MKMTRTITAFGALALNLITYGYTYSANNYLCQDLPFIHKIINPALYPNDLYVGTLDAFPSLYVRLLAWLSVIIPLDLLHVILYLGLKFAFYLAGYELAYHFLKDRTASVLAVLLFALSPLFNITGLLAGQPVFGIVMYHGSFAAAFVMISLLLFLKERFLPAFLLLAVLFYFNALLSAHLTVLFLAGTVINLKNHKAVLLKSWGVFLIALMPFLLRTIGSPAVSGTAGDVSAFLREWYPRHYFFTSWTAGHWMMIAAYGLFFGMCLFRARVSFSSDNKRTLFAFLAAVGAVCVIGGIASEVFPFRVLLVAQPFRGEIFLAVFGTIAAARFIVNALSSPKLIDTLAGALAVLLLADIHMPEKSGLALIIAAVILFAVLVSGRIRIPAPMWINRHALAAAVCLAVLPFSDILMYRAKHQALSYTSPLKASWHDVQHWARTQTPEEAKFITPPYLIGFRTFSQRGTFVERLDGGATHWAPGIELVWENRLEDLGYRDLIPEFDTANPRSPKTVLSREIYARLDKTRLREIAERHNIGYIITEHLSALPFPLLYSNEHFRVYRISRDK